MFDKYDHALEVIHDGTIELRTLLSGRQISDAQYVRWLEEEREYLTSKQHEPESDIAACDYIELLQKHAEAQ